MPSQWLESIAFAILLVLPVAVLADTVTVAGRDSEAIAAAFAGCAAGDSVFLPAGVYEVHHAIHAKAAGKLYGEGQDKTILVFKGETASPMIVLDGRRDFELCAMAIDGAGNANAQQGISARDASKLRLHHLTIKNLVKGSGFGPHGILFAGDNPARTGGVTDSEIADCRLENIAPDAEFGCGMRFSWGSSNNRVVRNTIVNTGRGGIFGDNGSTDLVIQGNMIAGSHGEGLAIEVWGGCDRSVIEDNTVDHWLSIGGSDFCAVRRNTVSDHSGEFKFCGLEVIGSYCAITGNTVDGGQKIGLSVSGGQPKNYVYWADNTARGCNQWGAQFQGEAGGISCHYLYRCTFSAMPLGVGPVWYPGDEGNGFRTNGNCKNIVFDECAFTDNGRLGLQLGGAGVDALSFVRCIISGNKGVAVFGPANYSALEWVDCIVKGNASNDLPLAKPFPHPAPKVTLKQSPGMMAHAFTASSTAPIKAALWDFDEGPPVFQDNNLDEIVQAHVFSKPGKHVITLLCWDEENRACRTEQVIDSTS